MTNVASFTFNPFQENTFVLYDDTKECIIIDPGCSNLAEQQELALFIERNELKPVKLLNTHTHVDHVLGNRFVMEKYKIGLELNKLEVPGLAHSVKIGAMYGFPVEESPAPTGFLEEGDVFEFGNTKLEVLFTPGHSIASISFYCRASNFVIAGDVLFNGSIGRTDLPGGNFNTLIKSIKTKLFTLADETTVYCGHGPKTTVGHEKQTNPFLT